MCSLIQSSPYLSKVNQVSKEKCELWMSWNCFELQSPGLKLCFFFFSTSGYTTYCLGYASQLTNLSAHDLKFQSSRHVLLSDDL